MSRAIEDAWERDGALARLLTPLSWIFGAAVATRNAAFDRGLFAQRPLGLPAVSVGNLTVGGTGKTPVSSWVAAHFLAHGIRPAILLRGYGDDEPKVHERLTPGAIVIANADRVAGARRALELGARVLVLDDAFQHRRARRDLDVVLIAAEQGGAHRLLPAGPLREGRRALSRAHLLIVTRKTASALQAEQVAQSWSQRAGGDRLPSVIVHLCADSLRAWTPVSAREGDIRPLSAVRGRRVLAISAIGVPAAFEGQLREVGAQVESASFPDHHAFSDSEVGALAGRARLTDLAVCTLKDAVKLATRWPANAPPFWYLSQAVKVEQGLGVLTERLDRLVAADSP